MKRQCLLSAFCLWPIAATAGEITSAYTSFDLETSCARIEAGDDYVFAGTWACPGFKGMDIVVSSADDRDFVGFGEAGAQTCAFRKTFNGFNTALSPVEWRLKNGKPFAAIERWRVVEGETGKTSTWLVVTALKGSEACHVHYVAGSYPEANAQARRAADDLAPDFDCERDEPTVDSKVGPPGIAMEPCSLLAAE